MYSERRNQGEDVLRGPLFEHFMYAGICRMQHPRHLYSFVLEYTNRNVHENESSFELNGIKQFLVYAEYF
jgi:hypothetical protein